MTFALSGWMLYAMWAVLGLMAVDLVLGLLRSSNTTNSFYNVILNYLSGWLQYVLPLFLIVNVMPLDPTEWALLVLYYVGAIGVIVKYLYDIKAKL